MAVKPAEDEIDFTKVSRKVGIELAIKLLNMTEAQATEFVMLSRGEATGDVHDEEKSRAGSA